MVDKSLLIKTGFLTSGPSGAADALSVASVQIMLQEKVQECEALLTALERVRDDTASVSSLLGAFL